MPVATRTKLCKRIIPCLDVAGGRTVKGVNFQNLRDVGDPVSLAEEYERQGADEITFLDISATVEQRETLFDVVEKVANVLSIPFTVGGGIRTVEDALKLLAKGADKVTVNSAAVRNPALVSGIAERCGSQCCVLAIDVRQGEVVVNGGRDKTGIDALQWARECVERGAGEILLTSWDRDGSLSGFDLDLVRRFATQLPVPVIASGGARDPQSFVDVFLQAEADAALAASIFHDGTYSISQVKSALQIAGVPVRAC
jgi:imidazole glycerol-phosphate synthase subunit HisF